MALELKKKSDLSPKTDTKVKMSKKAKAELDKPFVPSLPRVNLVSSEVQEVVEQQRLKRLFVVLGAIFLSIVAAIWVLQTGLIHAAQSKLDTETAKSRDLAGQQAALMPVEAYYAQVDGERTTIQQTMAHEILTSQVIKDLNALTPSGIDINSITLTLETGTAPVADPAQAASTCPSQDPYSSTGISAGCVTVDGTGASRAVLGQWLDAVQASDTFTVAFIPSTSADSTAGTVTFSATIGLDAAAVYTNRYSNPDFLKAGAN